MNLCEQLKHEKNLCGELCIVRIVRITVEMTGLCMQNLLSNDKCDHTFRLVSKDCDALFVCVQVVETKFITSLFISQISGNTGE